MKRTPTIFEFKDFEIDWDNLELRFFYTQHFDEGDPLQFVEKIKVPGQPTQYIAPGLMEQIMQDLHLVLGISYFKLYCASKFEVPYRFSKKQAQFWTTVYRKGLGEFLYRNKLDVKRIAEFEFEKKFQRNSFVLKKSDRSLVGIGGGKDSIVVAEMLKKHEHDFEAFVVETQRKSPIIEQVIQEIGVGKLEIKRELSENLFKKHPGSFNGHVPVSAMFAFLGVLSAILYDYAYVVVGNEQSSNEGNMRYQGIEINHQWSKSAEFERMFAEYLRKNLTSSIEYYSLLRPFAELRVAKKFVRYPQYLDLFSSCNRSYKVYFRKNETLWCGKCAKCAFVFLLLASYLKPKKLVKIFDKNLLDDEKLVPLYKDLLGYGEMKPFDCVGTFAESRVALWLSSKNGWGKFKVVKEFGKKVGNMSKKHERIMRTHLPSFVPDRWMFVGMENVLIIGYGREGKVMEKYLRDTYKDISIGVTDQILGEDYLKSQFEYDLAVKSPGVAKWKVKIPYTTATNLFFAQLKSKTIGVTGTKGKSTTSALIAHILKEAGLDVELVGNIGVPMMEAFMKNDDEDVIYVLELSSYQLEDVKYSPNIAVMLNIFYEHVPYHGTVKKYHMAKKRITKFQTDQDVLIYDTYDKRIKKWAEKTHAQEASYVKEVPISKFKTKLKGEHNKLNVQAAIVAVKQLGINDEVVVSAIESFEPLEHRMQFVGEYGEVKFYDDAISTTPESTIAAMEALEDVETIFLGGEDRGYEFEELEEYLLENGVKNIVLFPESGDRILKNKSKFNTLRTIRTDEAVRFAYKYTSKGKICLLSPASPSYSLWKNFEVRGDEFQAAVKKQANLEDE